MAALRDVLSCPVCTETFETEGDRKPKMTRCFHTFCLDCITQLVRLGKPCPTCRAELGIQNASELPNNFTLIQTLEAMEEEKPVLPSAPPPPFFHDAAPAPAVPLRSGPVLIFINGLNWPEDLVERQRIENESAIALRENYGAGTEIVFLQNKTFPTEQAKKIHSMIDTMQSSLMSIVPESTAGKVLLGGLFMAAAFGFREQVKKVGSALTAETKRSLENAATLLGNDLLELLQIYSDRRICLVAHSHGAMVVQNMMGRPEWTRFSSQVDILDIFGSPVFLTATHPRLRQISISQDLISLAFDSEQRGNPAVAVLSSQKPFPKCHSLREYLRLHKTR